MNEETSFEIQKMISFIRQESLEKAREIQLKANEEFQVEKAKLVQQEALRLQESLQRQRIQIQTQAKVQNATCANKYRIAVQQTMEDWFVKLKANCSQRIRQEWSFNPESYRIHLTRSLQQVRDMLSDEPTILLHGRKQDLELLQEIVDNCNERERFNISNESFLPDESLGGLVAYSADGRIKCDNAVGSRLDLMVNRLAPEIRMRLFGE